MPGLSELLLRLLIAAGFGALVGLEREISGQRAGLRTHMLVGLGACVFTEGSAFGFNYLSSQVNATLDPSRIAAQVVSGIGFLGAGAIIRYGSNVRGLTTAASLWVVAALGLATALGLYAEAGVAAVVTISGLVGLRPIRTRLRRGLTDGRLELHVEADPYLDLAELVKPIAAGGARVDNFRTEDESDGVRRLQLILKLRSGHPVDELLAGIANVKGVRQAEWIR